MKECVKCHKEKPIEEYYKHPKTADGHFGKCKECAKAYGRKHRRENESVQEYDRRRYHEDPKRRAATNASNERIAATPKGRKQKAARTAVKDALRGGKITKPTECSQCNQTKDRIEGHHEDYDKKLEVIWLCTLCHRRYHFSKTPSQGLTV